jgi:hypothetical protein
VAINFIVKNKMQGDDSAQLIAQKIVENNNQVSGLWNNQFYIATGVFITVLIISVLVLVLFFSQRKTDAPSTSPVVTPLSNTHYPDLRDIHSEFFPSIALQNRINGSPNQVYITPEFDSNIGVFVSNSVSVQFIVVNLNPPYEVKRKVVVDCRSEQCKKVSLVQTTTSSGIIIIDEFLYPFNIDSTTSSISMSSKINSRAINTDEAIVVPLSPGNTNVHNGSVVCDYFLSLTNQQFLDLKCSDSTTGEVISDFNTPTALVASGRYTTILTSKNQSFLSIIFLNSQNGTVRDIYNQNVEFIEHPDMPAGDLIHGATTDDTSTLITVFNGSMWVYTRSITDARPRFVLRDWMFFDEDPFQCSLDSTGNWFSISTYNAVIIIGNISESGKINLSSLYKLPLSSQYTDLKNTLGPTGLRLSPTGDTLYIAQTDNSSNISIFTITGL